MNRHPDFLNLTNIGLELERHDRHAVALRSVLAQGTLFRIFGANHENQVAPAGRGARSSNSGLLVAQFEQHLATLPILRS